MSACEKHAKDPVRGYSACPGCEIERLRAESLHINHGVAIAAIGDAESLAEQCRALTSERNQLKTENTDLHATLQAAKGEIERLKGENQLLESFKTAYKEYSDKTDWVQESAHWSELGMHRADVLRKRCDDAASNLQAQADQLKKLMAENHELVIALNEILKVTPMGVEAFGIAALVLGELGVSKEAQP